MHVTQRNEADALEFLQKRPKDRPFCLTVAFFAPHAEDGNPKQYLPQPGSVDPEFGFEAAGRANENRVPYQVST